MSASVAYPIQVLREHVTGLEAAITLCLADPGGKAVHKLRTETRRAEALLHLLTLVPDLPAHRKQASQFSRSLAKLRRAAGNVRDLDVQRKMLENFAAGEEQKRGGSDRAALEKAAAKLRKRMGHERNQAAADLQEVLRHRQGKTTRAAEALLHALEPADTLAVGASDLLLDAETILTRDGSLRPELLQDPKADDLHTIRKAAKAARYVAECLPEDPVVAEAVRRYEALQEAGGQWHDALELTSAARRQFGKTHELTARFREERNGKLDAYRTALIAQANGKGKRKTHRKPRARPASQARTAAKSRPGA